jgi:type II secretory pathway component GspD/PulD (secretin)/predicted lactoylglutathione lyase
MRYQAKSWSWKGLAARLLLVPVVSGTAVGGLVAQVRPATTTAPSATAPAKTAPADPKAMVKAGYEALKAGQFDQASDWANKANAVKGYKWGLFDDTPDGLLKEIASARSKADKAKSEMLLRDARAVYARTTKSPEERWANLEQATTLAYQAKNLHGAYAWYDMSDKPDSLLSEIESTRAKLRKQYPSLGTATKAVAKTSTPASPIVQTAGTGPATSTAKSAPSTAKSATPVAKSGPMTECLAMCAESRRLLKAGMPVEARTKALAARAFADTNRITFANGQESPDACYQACMAEGKKIVDSLTASGDGMMAKKDYAKAEAAYASAASTATALGLASNSIQDKLAGVRKMTGGTAVATAAMTTPVVPAVTPPVVPSTIPAPATAEYLVPAMPNTPVVAAPTMTPPAPVAAGTQLTGTTLLQQAEYELKKNDLETARKLAMQAYTMDGGNKADAQKMLATIDAETTERKSRDAKDAFAAALKAYHAKQFAQAATLFKLIDPATLPADKQEQMRGLMAQCTAELNGGITLASNQTPSQDQPGVAKVGEGAGQTSLADQQKTMANLKFAALRQEGNKVASDANALFGKGETDVAMQMMNDFIAKVKASDLSAPQQQLLIGPIDSRMASLRVLKHHKDFVTKEAAEKKNAKDLIVGKSLAEQQKQEEIAKSVRKINELLAAGKHAEAESVALRTKTLDPDNPQLEVIYTLAKRKKRLEEVTNDRNEREQFVYDGLRKADKVGPSVDVDNPLSIDKGRSLLAQMRGSDGITVRTRTAGEMELDRRLDVPITVSFENASVREIVSELRRQTKLNFNIDEVSITDEGLNLDTAIVKDLKLENISLRTVLEMALAQARLNFINDKGIVVVTTKKRSLGKLVTKAFSVMELVTPIPDFALAPHQNLNTAIQQARTQMPWETNPSLGGQMSGRSLQTPRGGLQNGELVSGGNGQGGYTGNLVSGDYENHPMAKSTTMAPSLNRAGAAEKLQSLIKYMVQPNAWEEQGGPGRIRYFDAGAALVVNQTADVIKEVSDLLESLRRLQDLSVAVEVRVVSLSDVFFERIGMDFNLNVKTNNTAFERQVGSGFFKPAPFINDIDAKGVAVGYSPATGFTPDLGVPVRATSYGLSQPPFGGYQNFLSPTLNGGLSLGMAFLNDIQVFAFLEAASGDRRTNIMQAPKITLFNGQTSTVTVSDFAYFTTGVTAFNFGGQVVFQPTNTAIPIGNQVNPNSGLSGVTVTIQAVISADRRFVRMNMAPSLSGLTSANVPLFPVTVFITPVFEGGSQGQPIPFTQFYQQPSFSQIEIQTTVSVPDGGTVLLGGLKAMSEGRSEFGPPVISQIPYLNRLFKNVGIGRETRHIMIMVTPRIIINSEEETTQTGAAP